MAGDSALRGSSEDMTPNKPRQTLPDLDPEETDEWLESLRTVTSSSGSSRARILLQEIMSEATALGIDISTSRTPYLNSISIEQQKPYPGNLEIEKKIQNNISIYSLISNQKWINIKINY